MSALAADFVLWLSGNHLGCLPLFEALGDNALIVQFDAHLDCYDLHDTHETLIHKRWLYLYGRMEDFLRRKIWEKASHEASR